MDTLIESWEHAGLTCELHYEEDASYCDPRDWENVGTMVCWHPNYYLGDFQIKNPEGRGAVQDAYTTKSGRSSFDSLEVFGRYLSLVEKALVVLPLSVYEHSGITMFCGHRDFMFDPGGWDTTYSGFIYATQEDVDRTGVEADKLEEALRLEVKTYASWLEGDVCGWCVKDSDGEWLDACGGYIGDSDYAKKEAENNAEYHAKERLVNQEPIDVAEVLAHERN